MATLRPASFQRMVDALGVSEEIEPALWTLLEEELARRDAAGGEALERLESALDAEELAMMPELAESFPIAEVDPAQRGRVETARAVKRLGQRPFASEPRFVQVQDQEIHVMRRDLYEAHLAFMKRVVEGISEHVGPFDESLMRRLKARAWVESMASSTFPGTPPRSPSVWFDMYGLLEQATASGGELEEIGLEVFTDLRSESGVLSEVQSVLVEHDESALPLIERIHESNVDRLLRHQMAEQTGGSAGRRRAEIQECAPFRKLTQLRWDTAARIEAAVQTRLGPEAAKRWRERFRTQQYPHIYARGRMDQALEAWSTHVAPDDPRAETFGALAQRYQQERESLRTRACEALNQEVWFQGSSPRELRGESPSTTGQLLAQLRQLESNACAEVRGLLREEESVLFECATDLPE